MGGIYFKRDNQVTHGKKVNSFFFSNLASHSRYLLALQVSVGDSNS